MIHMLFHLREKLQISGMALDFHVDNICYGLNFVSLQNPYAEDLTSSVIVSGHRALWAGLDLVMRPS